MLVGKILVAGQMGFCLLLLVVAGLFTRSLRVLTQSDIGFDLGHVLTVRVDVRGAGYAAGERQALYRRIVDSLQAVPGVASTSMSANGPLWGSQRISSLARQSERRQRNNFNAERHVEGDAVQLQGAFCRRRWHQP